MQPLNMAYILTDEPYLGATIGRPCFFRQPLFMVIVIFVLVLL